MSFEFFKKWAETLKHVYVHPLEFFKKMKTSGGYAWPIEFALASQIASGSIIFLFTIFGIANGFKLPQETVQMNAYFVLAASVLLASILATFSIFVTGGINYLFLKLFGGQSTYEATVRVMAFIASLSIIVSIFSFSGIVVGLIGLYSIFLQVLAYSRIHKISTFKALLAILIPTIASWLLAYYVFGIDLGAIA